MEKRPLVGVGVFIVRTDGKILLGKRKGSHSAGTWCTPGGHLEWGESLEMCAERETHEETGVRIKNIRFGTVTNDVFIKEDRHYLTVWMIAEYESGEAERREPDKCEEWGWFEWKKEMLPRPLFLPEINLLEQGWSPLGSRRKSLKKKALGIRH